MLFKCLKSLKNVIFSVSNRWKVFKSVDFRLKTKRNLIKNGEKR
jgi:hypothetical protein